MVHNDTTSNLALPLPHPDNELEVDVLRLRQALASIDQHLQALNLIVASDDINLDTVQEIIELLKGSAGDIGDITAIMATKASVAALDDAKANFNEGLSAADSKLSEAIKQLTDTFNNRISQLGTTTAQDLKGSMANTFAQAQANALFLKG